MKAGFFPSLSRMPYTLSSSLALIVLLLAIGAGARAAEGEIDRAAANKVLQKSPDVHAMPSRLLDKSMVQDVVRVGERLFLAGEHGHIGWSDDNGVTWQQASVPTIQDINAIFFVTQELGWAVGHDGNIFNTTDGGKTWQLQLDGIAFNLTRAQARIDRITIELKSKQAEIDKAQQDLDAAGESNPKKTQALQATVDMLQEEADEMDFQIRDAKKILEEENAPWPLMSVWFSDTNTGYAVGAFNALLMTTDGGKTWQDQSQKLDNRDGMHLNVVAGLGSTVLIGGESGLLFRSRDSGATWQKLESPSEGSYYAMSVLPTAQPGVLDILAVGIQGRIYHSTNSGDTWTRVEHDINNNLNGIYEDGNGVVLIVGNDGAMLRSKDGGATFETQHRFDQVTMTSIVVAANGTYVLAGATGIKLLKPDQWDSLK